MRIQSQIKAILASLALSLSVSAVTYADTPTVNVKEQFNQPDLQTALAGTPKHKQQADLSSLSGKTGEMLRTTDHIDFWFYDAWITLFGDRDYDGYFSGFSLEFDADTAYYQAPVYAIVYLGKNDYYEPFHVTSVFTLYGESSDDSVLLESDLVTGYPTGDYDILIELIDAATEKHVATIDAYTDADLSYQSLESADFDQPYTSEVVVEYHAGSWGIFGLLALAGLVVIRRIK
ncbi:choice-of-anchor H family protein [Alteromonas sp. AMM-1]|uniref:choice-of-anchor H family protein n=1 Tax=Alteromonas sp. AMM-1 TaxID=3394233 RepID=UPI0039A512BB